MKVVLILLGALVVACVLYSAFRFFYFLHISKGLVENTVAFEERTSDTSVPFLVLGDSTAVGVGAETPEGSLPGRVAETIGATYTENHARSGAVVKDLPGQIAQATLPHYRLILVQIGGNDIVRFRGAQEIAEELGTILDTLPPADRVVVISAGDVGAARLFPYPLTAFYTRLNKAYHEAFSSEVPTHGMTYVDFSKHDGNRLFREEPDKYLAPDGFHLSSEGYGLWFDAVKDALPR